MDKKLTLFELHFDGAKLGGLRSDDESDDAEMTSSDGRIADTVNEITDVVDFGDDEAEAEADESDEDSGRSVGRYLGLLAGVAVVGIAVRSLRRRGDDTESFDLDEDDVEGEEIGIER